MKNLFRYSCDNKRYHTLSYHNKVTFKDKIYKAVIDAGFTCPNKDGSKGTGGCIFCNGGSGYFTDSPLVSVSEQISNELNRIHIKFPNARAIAYFQANTNTYAPVEHLKSIYSPVISNPKIAGISIGTRGDCLEPEILDYLEKLSKETYLTVELGMQTIHEDTINLINRGYSHAEFLKGYYALKNKGIRTCIHIINGLPYETEKMMIETAIETGKLEPEAIKIQLLHVIKNTILEKMYIERKFDVMTKDEYISTVVKQLEYIKPETVIERLTGDGDKRFLVAPLWSCNKLSVLNGIDRLQCSTNSFQGKNL